MRKLLALLLTTLVAGVLIGCVGHARNVPEGDAWRSDAVAALEGTPGATSLSVTVHDVDSGTGYKGPLIQGSLMINNDVQSVVDDALLRSTATRPNPA
ncbi:MAG: hypothetical protein Q4P15_01235 [Propionibacteriaceae bacterium]|nr:hypothetical protein [Propionibacteriaceae bacterium]